MIIFRSGNLYSLCSRKPELSETSSTLIHQKSCKSSILLELVIINESSYNQADIFLSDFDRRFRRCLFPGLQSEYKFPDRKMT